MNAYRFVVAGLGLAGALAVGPGTAQAQSAYTECEMKFSMSGWSAIYKTSTGEGTVRCKNGETATVKLKSQGGGLTFGKSEIAKGTGTFSKLRGISEIYGTYGAASVEASASEGAGATVLTKGEVSLALSGTGRGVSIGFDFSGFTVSKP